MGAGSVDARGAAITSSPPVVDRAREIELLEAALSCGAHVLLEGPPGTGKSTLLRSVAADVDVPYVLVEGNAELTPARLLGQFDPALVLSRGYSPEIFADGPLLEAMRSGALLYVEELNRVPEETLNVLLSAMSEGQVAVPRLGRVTAAPGFAFIAAMNPFDAVGTARVSSALYDRTCRIVMGYQSAEAETDIVALREPDVDAGWRERVVEVVRSTRTHPDIEVGSSVRGAIDLTRLAVALSRRRGVPLTDDEVGVAAATTALSGRIRLHDGCGRSAEDIIVELYRRVFAVPEESRDDERTRGGESPGER
ncbi:hypothetical protein GS4_11_01520 [Gordonia soli NBRC 108243]|uniref:AAA+ ATPase domain-containing protein n=1 Tax=Gordonia soli NBRC 108243 TaxID=1223545 RepID=M0QH81_9ACTN|nr:hypothetical protein GS4_11_01520 [Gordonia soli NBRC 108243]